MPMPGGPIRACSCPEGLLASYQCSLSLDCILRFCAGYDTLRAARHGSGFLIAVLHEGNAKASPRRACTCLQRYIGLAGCGANFIYDSRLALPRWHHSQEAARYMPG